MAYCDGNDTLPTGDIDKQLKEVSAASTEAHTSIGWVGAAIRSIALWWERRLSNRRCGHGGHFESPPPRSDFAPLRRGPLYSRSRQRHVEPDRLAFCHYCYLRVARIVAVVVRARDNSPQVHVIPRSDAGKKCAPTVLTVRPHIALPVALPAPGRP